MLATINKSTLRFSAIVYTSMLSLQKAFASNGDLFGEVPDIGGVDTGDDTDSVREAILNVLDVVLSFMALIAVIFIVIAGIRLVISQGEEAEKDKAKKTIFYVIIGLVVILLAQAIVRFLATVVDDVNSGS